MEAITHGTTHTLSMIAANNVPQEQSGQNVSSAPMDTTVRLRTNDTSDNVNHAAVVELEWLPASLLSGW